MVNTRDLKSLTSNGLRVRVPSSVRMKTKAIVNGMSLVYEKGGKRRRDLETGREIVVMETKSFLNEEDTYTMLHLGYVYRGETDTGSIYVLYD